MYDDVTYVYDDVTYAYDDVTHTHTHTARSGGKAFEDPRPSTKRGNFFVV